MNQVLEYIVLATVISWIPGEKCLNKFYNYTREDDYWKIDNNFNWLIWEKTIHVVWRNFYQLAQYEDIAIIFIDFVAFQLFSRWVNFEKFEVDFCFKRCTWH